jgi:hypothetical protein
MGIGVMFCGFATSMVVATTTIVLGCLLGWPQQNDTAGQVLAGSVWIIPALIGGFAAGFIGPGYAIPGPDLRRTIIAAVSVSGPAFLFIFGSVVAGIARPVSQLAVTVGFYGLVFSVLVVLAGSGAFALAFASTSRSLKRAAPHPL